MLGQKFLLGISHYKIVTNIVENSDKVLYSGYGIAFHGKGGWSFGIDYDRNFIIFGSTSVC